jgi:L-lactate utilization protein LutB
MPGSLSFVDKINQAAHGVAYATALASCAHKCAVETQAHESLAEHKNTLTSVTGEFNKLGQVASQFRTQLAPQLIQNHPQTMAQTGGVLYLHGEDLDAYNQYAGAKAKYLAFKSKMESQ